MNSLAGLDMAFKFKGKFTNVFLHIFHRVHSKYHVFEVKYSFILVKFICLLGGMWHINFVRQYNHSDFIYFGR